MNSEKVFRPFPCILQRLYNKFIKIIFCKATKWKESEKNQALKIPINRMEEL